MNIKTQSDLAKFFGVSLFTVRAWLIKSDVPQARPPFSDEPAWWEFLTTHKSPIAARRPNVAGLTPSATDATPELLARLLADLDEAKAAAADREDLADHRDELLEVVNDILLAFDEQTMRSGNRSKIIDTLNEFSAQVRRINRRHNHVDPHDQEDDDEGGAE